ncbi:two-component system LytT family sensor kinase [Desulfitispora alkaliphila]|uniref:histidine kinase n=1 Tax=Desulfitispora alkaliphila TaxID=622674 RepID=UPI003D1A9E40
MGTFKGIILIVGIGFQVLGMWILGITEILTYILVVATSCSMIGALLCLQTRKPKTSAKKQLLDPTWQIATETMPYLRRGLNQDTAKKTAEIIKKIGDVQAVAITDTEKVLAYLGVGCDKHQPGDKILTEATKEVINTGIANTINSTLRNSCPVENCDCPLTGAIIVPLQFKDKVIGSLKLYQTKEGKMLQSTVKLAHGIAQLLSMQIELAELDRQTQLLTVAKLDALHAQINPHFLFNTLNTIITFSRTNPTKTRKLLIHLSEFFRQSLRKKGQFNPLREELEYVNTYLVLEKARFGPKLRILQRIDPEIHGYPIPVLSLQPLVENAVKHGVTPKIENGTVKIIGNVEQNHLVLKVIDDGVGIEPDKIEKILEPGYGSGNGVGLSNVNERYKGIYGDEYSIKIISGKNQGTTVMLRIPYEEQVEESDQLGDEVYEI